MRKFALATSVMLFAQPVRAEAVTAASPDESVPRPVTSVNVINAEMGASYVSAATPPDGGGAMLGAGAGVRLDLWSLGARVRVHPQPGFTMFQLLAEAGIHPLRGRLDPYAKLRGGYVSIAATRSSDPAESPSGFDLGLSLGSDYLVSSLVSFGFDATFDILLFARSFGGPIAIRETATDTPHENRPGYALVGALHMGLSFDL